MVFLHVILGDFAVIGLSLLLQEVRSVLLLEERIPTVLALLHAFPLSGVAAPLFSASVGSPANTASAVSTLHFAGEDCKVVLIIRIAFRSLLPDFHWNC